MVFHALRMPFLHKYFSYKQRNWNCSIHDESDVSAGILDKHWVFSLSHLVLLEFEYFREVCKAPKHVVCGLKMLEITEMVI